MFSRFFAPRLRCSNLFPGGMDGHCHILPGVDDGSPDDKSSFAIIEAQQKAGLAGAICTPHIMQRYKGNTPEYLRDVFERFNARVTVRYPGFRLQLAAEYMLEERFESLLKDKEQLLAWPAPTPVPGSPAAQRDPNGERTYLLVELPQYMRPPGWADMLMAVQEAGIVPVLAHPERYHRILDEEDLLTLHRRGVRFQGNIGSLVGYYSEVSQALARKLHSQKLYSWWGTDSHTPEPISHSKLRP